MSVKKVNEIFGYGLFIVGALLIWIYYSFNNVFLYSICRMWHVYESRNKNVDSDKNYRKIKQDKKYRMVLW